MEWTHGLSEQEKSLISANSASWPLWLGEAMREMRTIARASKDGGPHPTMLALCGVFAFDIDVRPEGLKENCSGCSRVLLVNPDYLVAGKIKLTTCWRAS